MHTTRRALLQAAAAGAALPLLRAETVQAQTPNALGSRLMGPEKFITIEGIRTRYFEGGQGKQLVLVHGGQWPATSSAEGWAPIFDHLAVHFHVYAFDKLGMGYTDNPKRDEDWSMQAVSRHAIGFVEAMGVGDAVICGHSRGALPAARILVERPDLVSHFVVLDSNALASDEIKLSERGDPPVRKAPPSREEIREAEMKSVLTYRKEHVTDALVESLWRIAQQPKIAEADRKFAELRDRWIRDNPAKAKANPLIANNAGSATWWMADHKHETLDMIRAGKLKAPTAIIWGWNDPFAPYALGLDTMQTIAKIVDRTEMHIVNHASHILYSDQPEAVARLITEFVYAGA
jgi:2-hydroxy-6-oxonona-2,4-dienedioate hydrolase